MDYKKLKFKAGIELHAQFDGKKLFCGCPAVIKDGKPDFEVTRKLRASASEMGEYDKAALHEVKKDKYFIYQGYDETNCLIELDEEPPKGVNRDALKIALQISLLLHCKPVDILQFMRKVVIDGSNVSGFQRTGLLAVDGYLDTSKGKVGIWKILLEEEAAKKVSETKECKTYNISRLGIAMVEVVTAPEIKDAEHAREVSEKIGMIIKSVKGTRRGLGSIRQDVNVSIMNGNRTETKGFQDYRNIPKVVEGEVNRQLKEIKNGKKIESNVRKVEPDFSTSFQRPLPGGARMYPETDVPTINLDKKFIDSIELPKLIDEQVEEIVKGFKINESMAREVLKEKIDLGEYIKKYKKLNAKIITNVLIEIPKEIKSRFGLNANKLTKKNFEEVLNLLDKGDVNREAVLDILVEIIKKGKYSLGKYQAGDSLDIEKEIRKLVENSPGVSVGGLMGDAMKKFKGKVDGKTISELIRKYSK
jgi:Glu-tRNA(Gln) amidotransferase subunit E-like FAD-binding protein